MIFDAMELYDTDSALDKLRLVDIKHSPDYSMDNERHFIYFQTKNDDKPIWKSEPFEGIGMPAKDFSPEILNPEEMMSYIKDIESQLVKIQKDRQAKIKSLRYEQYNHDIEKKLEGKQWLEDHVSSLYDKVDKLNLLIKQLEEKNRDSPVIRLIGIL